MPGPVMPTRAPDPSDLATLVEIVTEHGAIEG